MNRKALAATAALLAAGILAGCSSLKEEDVMVKVNDTEITAGVASFYARYTQAQYQTYYGSYLGDDMWSEEISDGETYEDSVKDSVMETLEDAALMEQHMEDYNVSFSDAEQKVIDDTAKAFDEANSDENKEKILGSRDTVERVLTLLAVQEKMTDAIEAGADTEVPDEEAAQKSMDYVKFSYQTTDENGESKDMSDEEKKDVKKQAQDFQKKVKVNPDSFSTEASNGGYEAQTASFDGESTTPDENLVAAADALKEGEVTDVIESEDACYVAVVTSLLDRDATDAKKDEIVMERKTELLDDTLKGWRDEAKIDLDKEAWEKVDFTTLQVTMKQEETDTEEDASEAATEETDTEEEDVSGADTEENDTEENDTEEDASGADAEGNDTEEEDASGTDAEK